MESNGPTCDTPRPRGRERYDITSRLASGRNVLGIHGLDLGGARGVIAAVRVEGKGQPAMELLTDGTWRATQESRAVDYSHPEFVEGSEWRDARVAGPMGMTPWGNLAWSEDREKARARSAAPRLDLRACFKIPWDPTQF